MNISMLKIKAGVMLLVLVGVLLIGGAASLPTGCCCQPGGSHECSVKGEGCFSYGNAQYQCQSNTGAGRSGDCFQCTT